MGAKWVHLRTCQQCGATLCCDSSPNRHATKHARGSGHPVVASAEPGERWLYCYPHETFAEYLTPPGHAAAHRSACAVFLCAPRPRRRRSPRWLASDCSSTR